MQSSFAAPEHVGPEFHQPQPGISNSALAMDLSTLGSHSLETAGTLLQAGDIRGARQILRQAMRQGSGTGGDAATAVRALSVLDLLNQSRMALRSGNTAIADSLVRQATELVSQGPNESTLNSALFDMASRMGGPQLQSGQSTSDAKAPPPTEEGPKPVQEYDPVLGAALVKEAIAETGGKTVAGGWCYHHVANAVDRVIGRFLYGDDAFMAASQLAAKKDLFTEVPATDLPSLPAGAIVVWGKGKSDSGHISIADGKGRELSDFIGAQMTSHYGGAPARAFLPKGRMQR